MSNFRITSDLDVIIVGGGLHGSVITLALAALRPELRVVVLERGAALGGNHTWCLHADDVPASLAGVIAPAIAHRWEGYDVVFVDHARSLASPYAAVTSASLAAAVHAACAPLAGFEIRCDVDVAEIAGDHVVLRSGHELRAPLVIDARGPAHYPHAPGTHGYQKFVGLELALDQPHGLPRPILMDARVPQTDGFRFFYVLPLAPDRVLVEDTYFSDSPVLDRAAVTAEVLGYATRQRFAVASIVRTEAGVLPLPLDTPAQIGRGDGPLVAGYQGGWFHPTTGYSFPLALRVAEAIARGEVAAWPPLIAEHARQVAFATRLNRMLFRWFPAANRHYVLARFYRLPEPTVRRFYALRTTRIDRARVWFGRPPRGMSWRAALTGGTAA